MTPTLKKYINNCTLVSCLWLVACASAPKAPEQPVEFLAHQAQVLALHQWQAQGKASVTSAEQNVTLNLDWRQNKDQLQLYLSGPLGQGNAELAGATGGYQLSTNRGVFYGNRLNDFALDLLGADLPLDSLRYWLLGLADPSLSSTIDFNELGLIEYLQQAGWQVHFNRYQDTVPPLPYRLDIQKLGPDNSDRARIVITQWQLP